MPKCPLTPEEILEMILLEEIQKELHADILNHINTGEPLQSSPATFETEELREEYRKFGLKKNEEMKQKRKMLDEWNLKNLPTK